MIHVIFGVILCALLFATWRSELNEEWWGIGAAAWMVLWGIIGAASYDLRMREDFLKECEADHRHYECVAMWRAGKNMTFFPMAIPTQGGK